MSGFRVERKWGNWEGVFAGDVNGVAAGDEEGEEGAGVEAIREGAGGVDAQLEVVEDEAAAEFGEASREAIRWRVPVVDAETECLSDGGQDMGWVADGGEGNEADAVRVGRAEGMGSLDRDPRLADAAGTGQSQQADVVWESVLGRGAVRGRSEDRGDGGGDFVAADERGERLRQRRQAVDWILTLKCGGRLRGDSGFRA